MHPSNCILCSLKPRTEPPLGRFQISLTSRERSPCVVEVLCLRGRNHISKRLTFSTHSQKSLHARADIQREPEFSGSGFEFFQSLASVSLIKGNGSSGKRLQCKRNQLCCSALRRSRNERDVGSCWLKLLSQKVSNVARRLPTTCNSVCKRTQHVTRCNTQQCWELLAKNVASV